MVVRGKWNVLQIIVMDLVGRVTGWWGWASKFGQGDQSGQVSLGGRGGQSVIRMVHLDEY